MKKIISILTLCVLLSCGSQKIMNETLPDEDTVILINNASEEGLKQAPFNTWYDQNYADYQVDNNAIKTLKPLLKGVKIKAFMGTWCSDSKRETPRFFKIMKAVKFRDKNIDLVTMTREKETPMGLEKGLNITNVPTFIFYKDGKEINRIVESPIASLEKDMIAILSGKDYKHTYAD